MASYRGFTVAFNSIGAGKSTKRYLLLATYEMIMPLLLPANKNMVEAKCNCELVFNTRALFRKGALDTWVKYQLVTIVAPTLAKHTQAKRMIEKILPGNTLLEEYRDTAVTRVQCNEFVPDNKPLVFSFHRNGITHHKYGELFDLMSPKAPYRDKETRRPIYAPWHQTKRERRGIFLPSKGFPLQRKLNMIGLLDMLLLGVVHETNRDDRSISQPKKPEENESNSRNRRSRNAANSTAMLDAFGQVRYRLSSRREAAVRGAAQLSTTAAARTRSSGSGSGVHRTALSGLDRSGDDNGRRTPSFTARLR